MIPKMFCKQGINTPIIVPNLGPATCRTELSPTNMLNINIFEVMCNYSNHLKIWHKKIIVLQKHNNRRAKGQGQATNRRLHIVKYTIVYYDSINPFISKYTSYDGEIE